MSAALKPYPEYRDSGVEWLGRVPAHWIIDRAKAQFHEVDERSATGAEELLSVSHKTGVTPRRFKNITMFQAESYAGYKLARSGDLVVNTMWAWMAALGVSQHDGIVSNAYGVYRPRKGVKMDGRYYDRLLRTETYRAEYVRRSTGITTSRLRLYPPKLLAMPLIQPPPNEQRLIADFLSVYIAQVHRLIAAKRRIIAILDEQRQQITEAVLERHGIATAKEMMLKRALDAIVGGSTPSPNPEFWDGDVVWITPADISASDRLSTSKRTLTIAGLRACAATIVPANSVILTSRAPVGNIAVADVPVATNQGCKALVPNAEKISTGFLALTVQRLVPLMRVLATGTTFQEISTGRLGAMKINVPTLKQQVVMLDAVKAETEPLNGAKRRILSEIDLILEYRDSLIAAVVTGELDVRKAEIALVEDGDLIDDTAIDDEDMEDELDAVD